MSPSLHVFITLTAIDVVEVNSRLSFDEQELANLTKSIKEHGVFQPIVVTLTGSQRFRLIAGERRFRASFQAGYSEIPCVIVEGDENALRSIQLDENLLRVQLNPLEGSLAFSKLRTKKKLSLTALTRQVKRSPDYVKMRLALLQPMEGVQAKVAEGQFSLGAAAELCKVALDQEQECLAQEAIERQLTIAQTAQLVREHHISLCKRLRREQLREKRDGLVRYFLPIVPAVITSETFDSTKHHLSRRLTFPECSDCLKKGIFVSDLCIGEDCCVDLQCYTSLARRESEAEKVRRQARAMERYTAFLRVTAGLEVAQAHLRYVLWVMLRGLLSNTDPWRRQVGLSVWNGGEVGTRDWMLSADWATERLLGGILELATDYLAHRSNAFFPLGLKQSLHDDFGILGTVLDLPSRSVEE